MKKRYILIILFIGACFTSCKEYLDVKPYGKVIPNTAEEFSALLHSTLQRIDEGNEAAMLGNCNSISMYESFTDNLDASLDNGSPLAFYAGSRLNSFMNDYRDLYKIVRDCNLVIENINEKEAQSDLGKKVLGTAYAMRGICYYNLIRLFAEPYEKGKASSQPGVPLVDHFDMDEKTLRSDLQSCIDFIVSDLKKAIENNVTDNEFLFTADVSRAYLARTYFWGEEWDQAIEIADALLKKYPMIQGDEYVQMIQDQYNRKGNVLVRSYRFSGNGDVSYESNVKNLQSRPVSLDFMSLFTEREHDIRFNISFRNSLTADINNWQNRKNCCGRVRTAEMCLILAESHAQLGHEQQALTYLNDLRSKRIENYVPVTLDELPAVNENSLIQEDAQGRPLTSLIQSILVERRKEYYMEGDRWFELKRNGRPQFWSASDGLKYVTQQFMYTAPLPKDDLIIVKGLKQNPGYE